MSQQYDDARYGVMKTLIFPMKVATFTAAPATIAQMYVPENITLLEIGVHVTTGIGTGSPTLQFRDGATLIGTLTLPTGVAATGIARSTTTLTGNTLDAGDTLIIQTALTTDAGGGMAYIRYKPRAS